eukprot:4687004-Pyramimonas_sp.AAC.1
MKFTADMNFMTPPVMLPPHQGGLLLLSHKVVIEFDSTSESPSADYTPAGSMGGARAGAITSAAWMLRAMVWMLTPGL